MAEFESRRVFEHIDKMAYEIGPRLAGTRGDKMAAEYIRKQFEGNGLKVKVQDFKFVNRSTRSKVAACLFAAAFVASFFLAPVFSLLAWLVAIALWRSLGKLMPKRSSQNIIATKEVESPKKRIAVTAHYDSAPCMVSFSLNLFIKFTFFPALALVTAVLALRALELVPAWPIVWVVLALLFLPICASIFVVANTRRVSPGAEDNASGTAVMLEAARVLAELPPPETSLSFIAFGAEEQSLVGSRILVKENLLPSDTLVLNLDMVGASPHPYIIEGNGLIRKVRTSASLNQKLAGSIGSVGLKPKLWWAALAGYDHAPLLRAGIKATTFSCDTAGVDRLGQRIAKWFKLPNARVRGYRYLHTVDDVPDRIGLDNIERAGAIVLDFVKTI
ncbi:MAG: M28 family peptidase [Methanobacteriota archaeon]